MYWLKINVKPQDGMKLYSTKSLREKCSYSEFFLPVFSRIQGEFGEIVRIFSFSVRMRKIRT